MTRVVSCRGSLGITPSNPWCRARASEPTCSTHQTHHAITSGGHTSVSAGKSWLVSAEKALRLLAYKAGLRIVSAVANVDMQALDKSIRFLAKVKITQTANRITLTAKEEIVINGGGSFTVLNGQGIQDGTSGAWTNHAASHATPKGKSLPVEAGKSMYDEAFILKHEKTGVPIALNAYRIKSADGTYTYGVTDKEGRTGIKVSDKVAQLNMEVED